MKALTKSLHTVTAVSRLAFHMIDDTPRTGSHWPIREAIAKALRVLGYDLADFDPCDPTVAAAYTATDKLLVARDIERARLSTQVGGTKFASVQP